MKKTPISFIIDDSAPAVCTPFFNRENKFTADGRPLIPYYPNEAIFTLADIIEEHGVKGKFSILPMACNQGDIINGFEGVDKSLVDEWLKCARERIYPAFSICPEILSHCKAVDLSTGKPLDEREDEWSAHQDRTTLTPYIKKAFELIKAAGFDSHGVTSPWHFGEEVENEYNVAISDALYEVYGYKSAYYFLHSKRNQPNIKPWINHEDGDKCVVSVPSTVYDYIWQTIDTPDTSEEFVMRVADSYITEDGKGGDIVRALEMNSYVIPCTHWQSLCSNGLLTGLRVLREVARRVNKNLSDRVEWMSFEDILKYIENNKESFR